jgi:hypothetical protein
MEVACLYISSLKGKKKAFEKKRKKGETESKEERTRKSKDRGEFQLAHIF